MNPTVQALANQVRKTPLWAMLRPVYRTAGVQRVVGRFTRRVTGFTAIVGEDPPRARDRGPAPVVPEAALRATYDASALSEEPDTYVLYRIIGNDIVPRHRRGQSRENVRFILEHEPTLANCEKRWIVNRIVNREEERAVCELLDAHAQEYLRIPYHEDEYERIGWDLDGLPYPGYLASEIWRTMPDEYRARLVKRLYRHKNNYIVNNNGARNTALADGCTRAKWILPWDGNCFLTASAWSEIREAIEARPWYPYAIVPMARTTSHAELLEPRARPAARDEPQIVFRRDAGETFDEQYYYSRRPKVELLWRLGVPGPWDEWAAEPWDLPVPPYAPDAGAWQRAGWVARLPSGQPHLEVGRGSETRRLTARANALTIFLRSRDAAIIRRRLMLYRPIECPRSGGDVQPGRDGEQLRAFERAMARPARRAGGRARRRGHKLADAFRELPLLLCARPGLLSRGRARRLAELVAEDARLRELSADAGLHGTWCLALRLMLSLAAQDFERTSMHLLEAADRASLLFARTRNADAAMRCEAHRRLWLLLDRVAERSGESLWIAAARPEGLR